MFRTPRPALAAAAAVSLAAALAAPAHAQTAKNVIYLVADGGGQTVYDAAAFYNGTRSLVEQGAAAGTWQKAFVSTYPLRRDVNPANLGTNFGQDPSLVYTSAQAWNTTPTGMTGGSALNGDRTLEFGGYAYHDRSSPDSANTISQSLTGVKTYNNGVNVDGSGNYLPTFTRAIANAGRSVGVVTTVQLSDATPASFSGVSNQFRAQRTTITDQMLGKFSAPGTPIAGSNATSNGVPTNIPGGNGAVDYIDVVMGAGNPDFDNNGNMRATPDYSWVSQSTWNDLKDGDANGVSGRYQLIQDRADFQALADGTLNQTRGKIVGVVKSFDGKQQYRGPGLFNSADNPDIEHNYTSLPGTDPALRDDVPSLRTMTQGALNILSQDSDGFFIGIEQGEVDRAMHANHLGRVIEAQNDFYDTIEYVDGLLTANAGDDAKANYANTLVIVTADHDHQLYGPDGDTIPFQDLIDNGAGNLPGAAFQTGNHSNRLVPLFARGAGSDLIAQYADQFDSYTDAQGRTFGFGNYLDQSELFDIFNQAAAVPEPTTGVALLAGVGLLGLRRRRN